MLINTVFFNRELLEVPGSQYSTWPADPLPAGSHRGGTADVTVMGTPRGLQQAGEAPGPVLGQRVQPWKPPMLGQGVQPWKTPWERGGISLTCPALPPSHRSPPRSPAGRWTWLRGPHGAETALTLRAEGDTGGQPGISTCSTKNGGLCPGSHRPTPTTDLLWQLGARTQHGDPVPPRRQRAGTPQSSAAPHRAVLWGSRG